MYVLQWRRRQEVFTDLKVAQSEFVKREQEVCLNIVKKDQLCAIALIKRK